MTRCVWCGSRLWFWQARSPVRESIDGGPVYSATVHQACAVAWLEEWVAAAQGPITISEVGHRAAARRRRPS